MTKIDKLITELLKNPCSLQYPEIEKCLIRLGFEKINAKGSHKKFKHSYFQFDLVIPVHKNDCKEFYKKEAAKRIKILKAD